MTKFILKNNKIKILGEKTILTFFARKILIINIYLGLKIEIILNIATTSIKLSIIKIYRNIF